MFIVNKLLFTTLLAVVLALPSCAQNPSAQETAPAKQAAPAKKPAPAKSAPDEREAHVYKTVGKRGLKLFVVKPDSWKATDARPALVFFHGGSWIVGKPIQFNEHSAYFATRGLVCIQVEYRLLRNPKDTPLVCIQDAKSAMRWVRSHAVELGVDPNRIGAAGGSAGGHLAAFASMVEGLDDPGDDLLVSPRGNAQILFNPAYDNGPTGFAHSRVGERFREFSPVHNVSKDDPPSIVFLGTNDNLIPVATAQKFKADMEKVGVRSELVLYEGAPHGFFNKPPYLGQTIREADKFLESLGWLKGPPTFKVAAK